MIDNLTFEIIKRIMADVGAIAGKDFGNAGLAHSGLLLAKTMTIRYPDADREHDIYAGKLSITDRNDQNHQIRGLLVNLSVDNNSEYMFVFAMDDLPTHAIKVFYENQSESFIRIYNSEKDKWIIPSVYMMGRLLITFEEFVSRGFIWGECKETSDLYKIAVKLIEN